MTKSELIAEVAERNRTTKKEVTPIVEAVFGVIASALQRREKVQLVGFGAFEVRHRKARSARNPKTQEPIEVGPSCSFLFRPGRQLRSRVCQDRP